MYYIFSSARFDLYRRGVLETCAYPDEHIQRYRYSQRLVPQDIQDSPDLLLYQSCMLVYAYKKEEADAHFQFLPLRHGTIVASSFLSGFLSIDVQLGKFLDYAAQTHTKQLADWRDSIARHPNPPQPEDAENEGFFVYEADPLDNCLVHRAKEASWQGVIDELETTPLKDCVTYRVLGFYKVSGIIAWASRYLLSKLTRLPPKIRCGALTCSIIAFLRGQSEKRIKPVVRGADCWYKLPMGGTVLLRIIIYRHRVLPPDFSRILSLAYDQKVFTSVSDDQFTVESRYDDVRRILSCARLADPTYSSFAIKQKTLVAGTNIWAAEPTFLMLIGPPWYFLAVTLAFFAFGLLCLNLSSSEHLPIRPLLLNWSPWIALLADHPRPLGTVCVLFASWNYLRKFPLK